jgi:hypothetical protein
MLDTTQALAAATRPTLPLQAAGGPVLVLGGGGALGSAVLEQLLGTHRFQRVGVAVVRPLSPALRGLLVVAADDASWRRFAADTAVIVFDRTRHANGREEAFLRPQPAELHATATRLQGHGVRRLIVAVPHAPALLPQALQSGLASMDEGAVAALGFEQLVFMRMAQPAALASGLSPPQRLARWMLGQLHWMVPQREQPVQAATVARVVAALALHLPAAVPGTRVLPAGLLWRAAQAADAAPLVQAWLAGLAVHTLPAAATVRPVRW